MLEFTLGKRETQQVAFVCFKEDLEEAAKGLQFCFFLGGKK